MEPFHVPMYEFASGAEFGVVRKERWEEAVKTSRELKAKLEEAIKELKQRLGA